MTWNIAIGCLLGGAAAVLVRSAARVSRYCLALWRVVGSVEPRQRGAGTNVPKPLNDQHSAAANDDRHGGAS